MIDEEARKQIEAELRRANSGKAKDGSPVMQIIHSDGSVTEVENPFAPMLATYEALAADPTAMPELNDESRVQILTEIKTGQVVVPLIQDPLEEIAEKDTEKAAARFVPNRHERRRLAALARRKKAGEE